MTALAHVLPPSVSKDERVNTTTMRRRPVKGTGATLAVVDPALNRILYPDARSIASLSLLFEYANVAIFAILNLSEAFKERRRSMTELAGIARHLIMISIGPPCRRERR